MASLTARELITEKIPLSRIAVLGMASTEGRDKASSIDDHTPLEETRGIAVS